VLGLALFLALLLAPAPEGLPIAAWRTAAAAALMATWWVTEAIPIPATSLVPLAVFPVLGIATIEQATTPYANPIIFLLLGGFLLALGMETWGLPRRMALRTIAALGHRPSAVIAGFMIAAAFLSMWVTNTATAMMMLPIGVSVIEFAQRGNDGNALGNERRSREIAHFATALMLGIAYACSIGGLATIVGTPPNAFAVGFLREAHGIDIAFAQWMLFALPVVVVGLAVAYLVLTRWAFPTGDLRIPGGREFIQARLAELGPMSRAERRVMVVFFLTAVLWIGRPLLSGLLPGLSDAGIAVGAGLVLFILPSGDTEAGRLLRWEKARSLPWGALLLFGGGLSLAAAFQRTGLTEWVGAGLGGLGAWPPILVVLAITTVMIFLTEFTSNTATAAAFLPLVGAIAVGIGENPVLLTVPAALAASCAFMLPVATGPNIVVYGSGSVTIPQMVRAGSVLNVSFIILITLAAYAIVARVFGT
jgi:sodium-dependent dicarboxylate transporter 2/3/5